MNFFKTLFNISENLNSNPKHYFYLFFWGVGMFLAATTHLESLYYEINIWFIKFPLNLNYTLALVYLFCFFLITTYKELGKMFLTCVVIGIVCCMVPILAAILTAASLLFILLKIKFLVQNWRALLVGFYAYFGGLLIPVFLRYFFRDSTFFVLIIVLIATAIFNSKLKNLYRHNYETERAFYIIGITPFTILALIMPFLKVEVDGQEVFHGLFSDHASIDVHTHIVDYNINLDALPDDLVDIMDKTGITDTLTATHITSADLIKLTGFNINDIFNVQELSQAIEASVSVSAAYGILKLSKNEQCTIRNENGTVEIVSPVDSTHSVIKDQNGNKIGAIYFDEQAGRETVILENGYTYSIEQATGKIVDGEGKILGKITQDAQGNKILSDENGAFIRKFTTDGKIIRNYPGNSAFVI